MSAHRFRTNITHLIVALTVAVAAACGSNANSGGPGRPDASMPSDDGGSTFGSGGNDGGSVQAPAQLFFVPDAATIVLDGPTPRSQSFTLTAVDANGVMTSVTAESVQFDRPDLATVSATEPAVATAPASATLHGGVGQIHALYRGKEAVATLTVQVHEVDYGPGLSATSPAVIALGGGANGGGGGGVDGGAGADGGAGLDGGTGGTGGADGGVLGPDPAAAISPLLYPYDHTVWPLGLTSPPIMWNAPQAGDVYRLHYAEKNYTFDGYYTLAALPGNLRLGQGAWDRVTASNDAKTGADPLAFALSRWDHVAGAAYTTASETWTIAPESLQGAIYYWTTTNGGSLSKIPPGAGAVPTPVSGPNGNHCMGCHAVSADGTTLVAGVGGQPSTDDTDSRAWTSFDVSSASPTIRKVSTNFSGNLAITPDGKYVVSGNNKLKLSDSTTGAVLPSGLDGVTLDANMTGLKTPAFAPDGKQLAAIEAGGDWQYWNYGLTPDSELVVVPFNPATQTFGTTPTKLVDSSAFTAAQGTINYPSFSPDSKWIAYQVGDHGSGCWVYPAGCQTTTPQLGSIYLQSTSSGAPIRLANLSDPPAPDGVDANRALEPTFNPIARGGYFWLVFTSERAWGNSPAVTGPADNDKKRLWVSAIDPATGTSDPSHPPFFLEGQDTTTQNMRGFWTVSACLGAAGPAATDAGAGMTSGSSDAATDGGVACVNGFDCCSGFCVNGQCANLNLIACSGVGGSCAAAGDCCNSTAVDCVSGTCQASLIR